MSTYLIGLDVGTTRVKAVAFDEAGTVVHSAERPTPWQRDSAGTQIDAGVLADLVRTVVSEAAEPLDSVAAVGATGMAEAGVLTDGAGTPLAPVRAWHDQRADVETVRAAVGADAFHAAVGLRLDYLPSLPKILQVRADHPECAAAVRFYSVPEWAVHSLGGQPGSELSLASRTGLLDVVTGKPWEPAIDLLGADLLGEPQVAGTPQGRVAGPGLPPQLRGAVLAVGGHDHQTAALAAGAVRHGTLFDSLGTAEALLQFTRAPVDRALVADLAGGWGTMSIGLTVVPGHYCVLAGLRTGFKLELLAAALGADDRPRRAALGAEALAAFPAEGTDSPLTDTVDVHLVPDGVQITLRRPAPPAQVWAAGVLTCVTEARPSIQRIAEVVGSAERFVAAGGWLHDPCVWEAKRRQLPGLVRTAVPEAGAAGAAYLAGIAAGLYPPVDHPVDGDRLDGSRLDHRRRDEQRPAEHRADEHRPDERGTPT